MRRITILLATVAAMLLVPAAQAFANGTMFVGIEGSGNGEVSSVEGLGKFNPGLAGRYEGSPPIECSYATPGPATGVCEDEMSNEGEGVEAVFLTAIPAPGSKLVGWSVEEGQHFAFCNPEESAFCWAGVLEGGGNALVIAEFECEVPGTCGGGPTGPTNRRTLTLHQSGYGTVSSKPKGVKCASACSLAEAAFYKNSLVTLTAKPGSEGEFEGWTEEAGTCTGKTTPCTVTMSEAVSLTAQFKPSPKPVVNPQDLTLAKAGSGYGTVKASGLTCEAECTKTTVAYFGGVTEPKPKAAATVTLIAKSAWDSKFDGWTGCESEVEGNCVVSMSSAKEVSAEFTLLPTKTLTVARSGNGTVSTKPKGLKCAAACDSATAAFPEGTLVTVSAKPGVGATFTGWTEGAGTCTGTTSPCTVTVSEATSLEAQFSPGKAIVNPQQLTLSKAGSGYGTVKATGLTCEALCTTTTVSYFGGVTEPKPKAAALVTLTAVAAPGSKTVEWSGCDEEKEGACIVSMSTAKAVTATFDELE